MMSLSQCADRRHHASRWAAEPSSLPTAMPVPAPINRTVLMMSVPLSASMELLTLSWVSNDSAIDSVVARSYGGELGFVASSS